VQGFAGDQVTAGEVGDGQRIAIAAIGEHELALVIGAPQIIGLIGHRQQSAGGFVTPSGSPLDQAMAVKDDMHRTDCRGVNIRIEPGQPFPDLRRSPIWLVLLQPHDQRLDLKRELIGMSVRPPRAVGQPFQSAAIIAVEDLVAGLARDVEIPADRSHLLAVQQPGDELQPFIHGFTLLPGHFALPAKGPIV